MSRYIAAYDIASDANRARVVRALKQFGERIQRSVFEVWLESEDLADLQRQVAPLLSEHDQFEVVPIDVTRHRPRWNWGQHEIRMEAVVVLGR